MLRRNSVLEKEFLLVDNDNVKENGRLTMAFRLKIEELEDKVYEDVREVEKVYFDPFEQDPMTIQKKLARVEDLLGKKHDALEKQYKKIDTRNEAMRTLAVDLANLRRIHENYVGENDRIQERIRVLQNVDDVHIQIDVLSTSSQGVDQLKEKYSKAVARFYLE